MDTRARFWCFAMFWCFATPHLERSDRWGGMANGVPRISIVSERLPNLDDGVQHCAAPPIKILPRCNIRNTSSNHPMPVHVHVDNDKTQVDRNEMS